MGIKVRASSSTHLAEHPRSLQIFEMKYRDDRIQWECDNAGQQWNQTNVDLGLTFTPETATGTLLPSKFCDIGVNKTYLTFTFCLLIDMVLLLYGELHSCSCGILRLFSGYNHDSATDI